MKTTYNKITGMLTELNAAKREETNSKIREWMSGLTDMNRIMTLGGMICDGSDSRYMRRQKAITARKEAKKAEKAAESLAANWLVWGKNRGLDLTGNITILTEMATVFRSLDLRLRQETKTIREVEMLSPSTKECLSAPQIKNKIAVCA